MELVYGVSEKESTTVWNLDPATFYDWNTCLIIFYTKSLHIFFRSLFHGTLERIRLDFEHQSALFTSCYQFRQFFIFERHHLEVILVVLQLFFLNSPVVSLVQNAAIGLLQIHINF